MRKQRRKLAIKTSSLVYTCLIYLFLYLPIIVIVVFSFNTSKRNIVFEGFTLDWYAELF